MMSRMRLPLYVCPACFYSFILIFVIFILPLICFASDNNSGNNSGNKSDNNSVELESTKKIHITADSLVSDSNAKFAEFIGKVEATQGDFIINSDKLKIFYKGNLEGQKASGTNEAIDKIIATGNVNIKSKDMSAVTQKAEYNAETMVLTLKGEDSKVFEQKNYITGSKIIVYRKEGKTKVEGDENKRVTAVFYPKENSDLTNKGKKEKEHKAKKPLIASETLKGAEPELQKSLSDKTGQMEKEGPLPEKAEIKPPEVEVQNDEISQIGQIDQQIDQKDKKDAKLPEPVVPVVAKISPEQVEPKPEEPAVNITPGKLKKSMGLTLFEDKTVYGANGFEKTFYETLTKNIKKKCPDTLFLKPGNNNYPSIFIKLPTLASGDIDSYKLCETGRQLGLTSILVGSVTDIKTNDDPRGILFWKKTVPEIIMTVRIELFDTESGTKLFDKNYTYKEDSDKAGVELVKSGKIDPTFLKMALKYYMSSAAGKLCDTVREQGWKGFISAVSDNKAQITSGKNLGLTAGMIFNVYENKIISGVRDRKFIVPGLKTGKVKIAEVFDNSSEAVIISGTGLKEGYSIKAK